MPLILNGECRINPPPPPFVPAYYFIDRVSIYRWKFYADPVAKNIGVWTSGASVPGLKTYFWVSKLSLFFYSNWFYGEPRPTSLSECVRIAPVPEGPWASTPCEQWLPFVCQDWESCDHLLFIIYSSHILQHSRKGSPIIHGIYVSKSTVSGCTQSGEMKKLFGFLNWTGESAIYRRNSTWDLAASPSQRIGCKHLSEAIYMFRE
jgi:hypothetical protein